MCQLSSSLRGLTVLAHTSLNHKLYNQASGRMLEYPSPGLPFFLFGYGSNNKQNRRPTRRLILYSVLRVTGRFITNPMHIIEATECGSWSRTKTSPQTAALSGTHGSSAFVLSQVHVTGYRGQKLVPRMLTTRVKEISCFDGCPSIPGQ